MLKLSRSLSIYEARIDGSIDGCGDANPESLIVPTELVDEFKEDKKTIQEIREIVRDIAFDLSTIQKEYDMLPMRVKPIEEALNRLIGYKRQV